MAKRVRKELIFTITISLSTILALLVFFYYHEGDENTPPTSPPQQVVTISLPVGPGPTNYHIQIQPAPGTCLYRESDSVDVLPDPNCTPGAVSPKVTQDNLNQTICKPGYTKSIRPPQSITQSEKRASQLAYSYMGEGEYDHLVSLELGGDPNDPRNLWIEPGSVPNSKDKVEAKLHTLVCAGKVSLAQAQSAIADDWTTALDVVQG